MNGKKGLLVTITSALTSLIGALAIPMLILVGCNLIDYGTALISAKYRNQTIDSNKGFKGIAKKVSMWLLVVVGAIVDWLIFSGASGFGFTFPFDYLVSSIVAYWLICNELISILENIADTGIELPSFLKSIVKNLKKQAENKAIVIEDDKEEGEE